MLFGIDYVFLICLTVQSKTLRDIRIYGKMNRTNE